MNRLETFLKAQLEGERFEHHEDVAARIDELKLLADGWLDGAGKALNNAALEWVQL